MFNLLFSTLTMPTNEPQKRFDKLAEAKKLIANSVINIYKVWSSNPDHFIEDMPPVLTEILVAQSLISYEKGREEQRKETYKEVCELDANAGAPPSWYEAIAAVRQILNHPSSDAKI